MARLAVHNVSVLVGGRVSPDRKRLASLASPTFDPAGLLDPPHKTTSKKKLLTPAAPFIDAPALTWTGSNRRSPSKRMARRIMTMVKAHGRGTYILSRS